MPEPMYRQIADDLQRDIESGVLAPGAQLKTEEELRGQFGRDSLVSRNTIREAIKLLVSRGLVETRPGQGTFVVDEIEPITTVLVGGKAENPGQDVEGTEPRVEIQRASDELSGHLGLQPGATVISRHQERRIEGEPWSLQTTFYPMEYVTRGATRLLEAADIPESVMAYLEAALGITEVGHRDLVKARTPDRNEAAFFGLPDDGRIPVLEVRRTGFDANGGPTRLTLTVFSAARNRLAYDGGKTPPLPRSTSPRERDTEAGDPG